MPSKAILPRLSPASSLSVRELTLAAVDVTLPYELFSPCSFYSNLLVLVPFAKFQSVLIFITRDKDLASSFGKDVSVTAPEKAVHPDIDSRRQEYSRIYIPGSGLSAPSHHSPRVLPSEFGRWFLARAEGTSSMPEHLFLAICFLFNDGRVTTFY